MKYLLHIKMYVLVREYMRECASIRSTSRLKYKRRAPWSGWSACPHPYTRKYHSHISAPEKLLNKMHRIGPRSSYSRCREKRPKQIRVLFYDNFDKINSKTVEPRTRFMINIFEFDRISSIACTVAMRHPIVMRKHTQPINTQHAGRTHT